MRWTAGGGCPALACHRPSTRIPAVGYRCVVLQLRTFSDPRPAPPIGFTSLRHRQCPPSEITYSEGIALVRGVVRVASEASVRAVAATWVHVSRCQLRQRDRINRSHRHAPGCNSTKVHSVMDYIHVPDFPGTNEFQELRRQCERSEKLVRELHALTTDVRRQVGASLVMPPLRPSDQTLVDK